LRNFAVRRFLSQGSTSPVAGDETAPSADEAAPPARPAAEAADACRLLLVEDNPINQTAALAVLNASFSCRVDMADNGFAAVRKAAGGGYDLILMDVQMPELDGLEATRQIRALPGPAGRTPIVGMTAHTFAQDQEACLNVSMDDYISKLVDRAELIAKLRYWTAHGGQVVQDTVVGGIWHQAASLVVTGGDRGAAALRGFGRAMAMQANRSGSRRCWTRCTKPAPQACRAAAARATRRARSGSDRSVITRAVSTDSSPW